VIPPAARGLAAVVGMDRVQAVGCAVGVEVATGDRAVRLCVVVCRRGWVRMGELCRRLRFVA
jgi:hypothetical protein